MRTNLKTWLSLARPSERGAALPLVAVALLTMLAMAGLAVDTSHALANKTRLQNTVDAAALAAAKEYDDVADIFAGNAAALSLFGLNADGAGNHELNQAYDASEISVAIQWSEKLDPFINAGEGPYVRVVATGYQLNTSLLAVMGITELEVRASAVAGPSPSINTACNIAPMVVCAENPDTPPLFGFTSGQIEVMKSASHQAGEIGPGNFQLIRLEGECEQGKDCTAEGLAGEYNGCATIGNTVDTEPGNAVGPVSFGINTRFGEYKGLMNKNEAKYPPDVVITQPDPPLEYDAETDTVTQDGVEVTESSINFYGWDGYNVDQQNPAKWRLDGVHGRRVLALPIARCDGSAGGQVTLEVVGFGCYFLLQEVEQTGTNSYVYGQFIDGCKVGGMPGPDPGAGTEPYIIQLYKDPFSSDS